MITWIGKTNSMMESINWSTIFAFKASTSILPAMNTKFKKKSNTIEKQSSNSLEGRLSRKSQDLERMWRPSSKQ